MSSILSDIVALLTIDFHCHFSLFAQCRLRQTVSALKTLNNHALCTPVTLSTSYLIHKHLLARTVTPNAMKKPAGAHFEEHGLRVPLLKLGQKRLHARSVEDLATKSKEGLVVIVKAYAEKQAPKILKTLASKTALAEWIERVETLALGPHPESKLSCKWSDHVHKIDANTVAATKKEDIVEALGLKASGSKAKVGKAEKNGPSRKSAQKKTASPPEGAMTAGAIASPPSKTAKSKAAQKQDSVEPTTESSTVTHTANMRKRHSAGVTEVAQTPVKKTKTKAASPSTIDLPDTTTTVPLEATTVAEVTSAPSPASEQASPYQESSAAMADTSQPTPSHTEVQEEPELELEQYFQTSNAGQYHATQLDEAIHSTFIPDGYDGDACPACEPEPARFLKRGRHGRHGDFTNDPDLLIGRGHQIDPADLKLKREYEAKYHAFYATWPHWPFVDKQKRSRASECVEGKAELDKAELWMRGFRDKYPGEVVGHLWACGCEIPSDGDDSEEE